MKLIIQIPCYNEEKSIERTIKALPRFVEGIDEVKVLVIDDGSNDNTADVAKSAGADYLIRHRINLGLARAFMTGLSACLEENADVIVNTDADNQYCADDISKLIRPILDDKADMVIGTRPIASIDHFSWTKKRLQLIGSWLVRKISNVKVDDAPSGFRAISRHAALKLNVFSSYTYTLETIIQAGYKGLAVECVPIRVNQAERPSRLVKGIPSYIGMSVLTVGRIFATYRPFRFFMALGLVLLGIGVVLGVRFLVLLFLGEGSGHVQSLILTAILILMGFQVCVVGVLADLISVNRKILEDIKYLVSQVYFYRKK